ncbi:MAG: signal peptidase II [Acidimicrobiia bacterium]
MRVAVLTTRRLGLGAAAAVILVDQLTKWWAVEALAERPVILIDDVLRLAVTRNPGAAFGVLRGAGSVLALVAIAFVVVLIVSLRVLERRAEAIALGLILGGALGNLADRLFRGGGFLDGRVVDFFDLSFFPAFNLADAAITVGALLAVLEAIREH